MSSVGLYNFVLETGRTAIEATLRRNPDGTVSVVPKNGSKREPIEGVDPRTAMVRTIGGAHSAAASIGYRASDHYYIPKLDKGVLPVRRAGRMTLAEFLAHGPQTVDTDFGLSVIAAIIDGLDA